MVYVVCYGFNIQHTTYTISSLVIIATSHKCTTFLPKMLVSVLLKSFYFQFFSVGSAWHLWHSPFVSSVLFLPCGTCFRQTNLMNPKYTYLFASQALFARATGRLHSTTNVQCPVLIVRSTRLMFIESGFTD